MFENSINTLEYTFHYSKLSCYKPMYFAHMVFAYLIMLSGVGAFVTRLSPRLYFLHSWLGKLYIIFMLWGTATSLLVHNTGLPLGVLYSFIWVGGCLSVGWIIITLHQKRVFQRKRKVVGGNEAPKTLFKLIFDKMISLKALHGCLMFVSWINIAGRVFVTPPVEDFQCYTYPVYKQTTSKFLNYTLGEPLTLVPSKDPNYSRQPWASGTEVGPGETRWLLIMFFGPYVGAFLVRTVVECSKQLLNLKF
ncbi:hypothetical protein HK096_000109, partial [Nowakowskiella sp. JEL0078]